jgi:putative transposase
LKQVEGGRKIAEVCREMGVTELRRLKQLEDENLSLRKLVADLSLDKHILQEIVSKSSKARAQEPIGAKVCGSVWHQSSAWVPVVGVKSIEFPLPARGTTAGAGFESASA